MKGLGYKRLSREYFTKSSKSESLNWLLKENKSMRTIFNLSADEIDRRIRINISQREFQMKHKSLFRTSSLKLFDSLFSECRKQNILSGFESPKLKRIIQEFQAKVPKQISFDSLKNILEQKKAILNCTSTTLQSRLIPINSRYYLKRR